MSRKKYFMLDKQKKYAIIKIVKITVFGEIL